ncbi:DUF3450 domain-containing protein [Thalassotalea insulae]|uniref:DUF3450 domain-containing protein n=1 Tax=Thalassotalea insulae TaxID=2056778 RepID=A0ABQ6GUV2_9GAMM|nr:DUF3450 domain-containing protein [Thalassotalea insulae]GLX79710.1 DUF3450 domain-containing protein [Thalassotalea insulae]
MKLSLLAKASLIVSSAAMSFSGFSQGVNADNSELTQVVDAGKKINQMANNSQQRVDKLNEQIQSKLQQFKTVNKEIDGLTVYNKQMKAQIDNQLIELQQLAESMEQVSIIERQVSPLMARMIDTLAAFVALDVPFLPEERNDRIENLKAMLDRADVSVAEKFRRVLEAYQVEVDYGRTIEAYTGLQQVESKELDVDFLRIGRVSLVYRSRDGKAMGMWDQTSKSWQPLDSEYRTDINKALRIARKQLAPDLIVVPVAQNSAE